MTNRTEELNTGNYGPDWTYGIVTDHVPADATIVFIKGEAHVKVGIDRIPVLCGDLIEISTEDGPIVGRCGAPVRKGSVAELAKTYDVGCEGHAAERHAWHAMTERDRLAWEKANEDR